MAATAATLRALTCRPAPTLAALRLLFLLCHAQKHGEAQAATMALDRTLDHTRAYAQAVREAGKQLGLPVVDLYDAMQKPKVWRSATRTRAARGRGSRGAAAQ